MTRYTVTETPQFAASLRKLDREASRRIMRRLYALADLDDPRVRCKPLTGPLAGLWRLRVDDYRAILDLQADALVIVALDAGHRSKIYDTFTRPQ